MDDGTAALELFEEELGVLSGCGIDIAGCVEERRVEDAGVDCGGAGGRLVDVVLWVIVIVTQF